uniref:Uncharacterized protein n=1 Tax=Anopheles quadriannulatus TaxID=34691 RepID=A0A182XT37_ANOQN
MTCYRLAFISKMMSKLRFRAVWRIPEENICTAANSRSKNQKYRSKIKPDSH